MIRVSSSAVPSPRRAAPFRSITRTAPNSACSAAAPAAARGHIQTAHSRAAAWRMTSFEPSHTILGATRVMRASPIHEIQKWRARSRAIYCEATPISATDSSRPKLRIQGCARAVPAKARTLSSDIETSARMIWPSACAPLLRAAGKGEADDLEQLHREQGEQNAQHSRDDDAEGDNAPPPRGRQAGRRHADDDRVVAGEHHIDDHHRYKGAEIGKIGRHF